NRGAEGNSMSHLRLFPVVGLQTNLVVEDVMHKSLSLRYSWMWLASFLLAAAVFLPAAKLEAQVASSEFSQNVKELYFPFNVYKKINNPAVLDQDAEWLKQHSDANFWIQGYADVRGDIFYNL